MKQLLTRSAVTKAYRTARGGQVTALGNVSLQVANRQIVAVLGPGGCGKSTLLRDQFA